MMEMVETATILNHASHHSLVILDEIGRGTSTFDGLSIAWAAVEYLHEVNHCRAILATHFHEMTALTEKLDRLHNVTMKVKNWDGDVVFFMRSHQERQTDPMVYRLQSLLDFLQPLLHEQQMFFIN